MTDIADATDSSTVEKLAQAVEDLRDTVERQTERIDELEETAETQRQIFSSAIAAQAARIGELEDELAEHKDHTGREFAGVRGRITDVENQATEAGSEDATPGVDGRKEGSQNAETPLERICALPEHVADRELTANQERARFIARDVRDYAEKAPAGLVIDSRAIKRVLTASEGKRPHTQTVARVMDFLDGLGKGDVQLKKRRGKKLIVVNPEAADRYADAAHHNRCDGGDGLPTSPDVIVEP